METVYFFFQRGYNKEKRIIKKCYITLINKFYRNLPISLVATSSSSCARCRSAVARSSSRWRHSLVKRMRRARALPSCTFARCRSPLATATCACDCRALSSRRRRRRWVGKRRRPSDGVSGKRFRSERERKRDNDICSIIQ